MGVVAAYGQILSRKLLGVPRLGLLNLHPSLLPRWRGAAPIQRALLEGDAETGVCVMRVAPELDAGAVLARRAVPIGPRDTSGTCTTSSPSWGPSRWWRRFSRSKKARSHGGAAG